MALTKTDRCVEGMEAARLGSIRDLSDSELLLLMHLARLEAMGDRRNRTALRRFWSELGAILNRERTLRQKEIRELERLYFRSDAGPAARADKPE